jgi:uncharacterized HAD superfamily protein
MKKIHLVLDCDDVLIETWRHFIKFLETKFRKKYNFENKYIAPEIFFEIGREGLYRCFDEYNLKNKSGRLYPMRNAQKVLAKLIKKGFKLSINTARKKETSEYHLQKYALNHFNIQPQNVHCAVYVDYKPIETKADICKRIDTHIFVEDSFENAKQVAEAISDSLVLLYTQPTNKHVPFSEFPKNMERVHNWSQIEDHIIIYEHFAK